MCLRTTYPRCECDHLLLHRSFRVAKSKAFKKIPPEKRLEPAQAFILGGVP